MISGISGGASNYLRPLSMFSSNPTSTPADIQSNGSATTDSGASGFRVNISQLKLLQGAKPISAADDPILHDLMATNWLTTHGASATQSFVSDDAPQNTYAQVKVDGKVVATVYNGGSSTMTSGAAAKVGSLQDPPGLSGPDLAQWRADSYAKLLGGTVEKAPTAITQSQWTPHESSSTTYSREELDAAFQAMLAEGQKAVAQRQSSYLASQAQSGARADFSA
jgi:hypothetical protein